MLFLYTSDFICIFPEFVRKIMMLIFGNPRRAPGIMNNPWIIDGFYNFVCEPTGETLIAIERVKNAIFKRQTDS